MGQIRKITGSVEMLGQSKFSHHGHTYSYIRFRDRDGRDEIVNNVMVLNNCGSYLSPGTNGDFYVAKLPFRANWLAAMRTDGHAVHDGDTGRGGFAGVFFKAMFYIVLGLVFSLFLIGIPVFLYGVMLLWLYFGTPGKAQVEQALAAT